MKPTLVDTSTLITLALAIEDATTPFRDAAAMRAMYGAGLDGAIGAFVLYDDLRVDQPSISRNIEKLPSLELVTAIAPVVPTDLDEDGVYHAVAERYLRHLDVDAHLEGLAMLEADAATTAEVGTSTFGPAGSWREVESELSGAAAGLARRLRETFGATGPASASACATLLRTLYYDQLQQTIGADLIVHPAKAAVREPATGAPVRILDAFDADVRSAFAARRTRWLGNDEVSFEIPLLTEYVLTRCGTWRDLPAVIADLRTCKRAADFRRGVSDILLAVAAGNHAAVNAELEKLDAARAAWQHELGSGGVSKTISLSVPLLPISADIEVPDRKLIPKASDRILSFVHLLLQHTMPAA
jgi:hypothetical protein